MAQLVHFEQDPEAPNGAGVFHFDSGASQYAYEPDLAAQISKTKGALDAAPDNRTADNSPVPFRPTGFAGRLHDQGVTTGQRELADATGIPTAHDQAILDGANRAVGTALAGSAMPPQQGPGPLAAPPPSAAEMAGQARDVMGQRAAEDLIRGTKRTYSAGSPGVDPHKMIQQGVMVPHAASTVMEAGAPYDPEQAKARIAAGAGVLDSQLSDIDLHRQQTQNQLASQRALAPQLQQAAAAAQANHDRMIASYRVDRSRLQQELDDYDKTAHVNPSKFFEDRGVFATIGMAIAQGLGAYASTMTGAPNFAYEMTQKAIDRDIAAQRDQIEAGRVGRRNKMAQMMDSYGFDLNQADAALRIAMNKSAELQATMYANEAKMPQYQAEAQKLVAMFGQDTLTREQAFQNASIGKRTSTVSDQFIQPKAATGPGYIEKPLTAEEQLERSKLLPKEQITPGQDWVELKPEQRVSAIQGYGAKKQEFADSRAALSDLADAYGLKVDWSRGEVIGKDGKPVNPDAFTLTGSAEDIPGVGRPSLNIQGSHRVREARSKVQAITGKALSGASVSPEQNQQIQSYALGDDDAAAVRGLQRAVSGMNDVERQTDATFPDEARQEYDRRAHGVNRTRKSAAAPVKVSDY